MKNTIFIILAGLLTFFLTSCNKNSGMNNNDGNQSVKENLFKTSEEAVTKGKNDLLSLVKNNKEFNLGIDAGALERSAPGRAVPEMTLNFERLMQNQRDSIAGMLEDSRRLSTPLLADNTVVTVIGTSQTEGGWRLGELGDKEIANDLTELGGTAGMNMMQVSRIEVPNLQATIYEVSTANGKQYFTNYGGRSLREPVNQSELLKQLQADAVRFQREFGNQLKKNNLVR